MSKRSRQMIGSALALTAVAAGLITVNLTTDPIVSNAQVGGPLDDVAIVFVVDGSPSIVNASTREDFTLATEGIAEFLSLPGIPLDGGWEVAVLQFAKPPAAGSSSTYYEEDVHWIDLTEINATSINNLISSVESLEHCSHTTGSLLEMGISEATSLLDSSTATDKHIILISSGEYRLPWPYPDVDYAILPGMTSSCPDEPTGDLGNRACQIRELAENARNSGIMISALHIGQEWSDSDEDEYGDDSCSVPQSEVYPPATPNRGMLLREITNTDTCDTNAPVGKFQRINPQKCWLCGVDDWREPRPTDISSAIATWMCEEGYGHDTDSDGVQSPCDNCPTTSNERQRDCNRDGIGDACQGTTNDADDDGLDDEFDTCYGGDDCLVASWTDGADCERLDACGCDCDHNDETDACQHAIAIASYTLPYSAKDTDSSGVADYCEDEATKDDCTGVPAACRVDYVTGFTEPFDSFTVGTGGQHETWVHNKTDDTAFDTAFEIEAESAGDNILVMNPVPTGTGHWMVTGESLTLPEWTCDPYRGCSNIQVDSYRWGAYEVTFDIKIDSSDSTTTTDVYIYTSCDVNKLRMKRVHLIFVKTGSTEGHIFARSSEDPGNQPEIEIPGFYSYRMYEENQWQSISILFNVANNYTANAGECEWDPRGDVRIRNSDWANSASDPFDDLMKSPSSLSGIQIGVSTHVANKVSLDNVNVNPITICQWYNPYDSIAGIDSNKCCCMHDGTTRWLDNSSGCCGISNSLEGTEECDLGSYNGEGCGCSSTCEIEPITACGNSFVDCPNEECDLGTKNGHGCGCSSTCEIEQINPTCGDGIICPGECEPPNTATCDSECNPIGGSG